LVKRRSEIVAQDGMAQAEKLADASHRVPEVVEEV
jgi:hypothetical protein